MPKTVFVTLGAGVGKSHVSGPCCLLSFRSPGPEASGLSPPHSTLHRPLATMRPSSLSASTSSTTTNGTDDLGPDMLPTPPSTHTSRSTSPACPDLDPDADPVDADTTETPSAAKKKKKKKAKKSTSKARQGLAGNGSLANGNVEDRDRPPVLCISRNKHWRYISSYHVCPRCVSVYHLSRLTMASCVGDSCTQGPWLQLPLELLESLLVLNLDPATLSAADAKLPPLPSHSNASSYTNGHGHSHSYLNGHSHAHQKQRDRGFASLADYSPPDSPRNTFAALPPPPPFPSPMPGQATPPPIDPGVFRSVTHIRRLIDEAAELSVRASSGLSAAALGSMRGAGGMNGSAWATAQSLGMGMNPLGDGGVGRNVAMSAMRVHRLRALAVQKLAAAYKADEIASSVMVMQGGSVFDDIAERVLKIGASPFGFLCSYVGGQSEGARVLLSE